MRGGGAAASSVRGRKTQAKKEIQPVSPSVWVSLHCAVTFISAPWVAAAPVNGKKKERKSPQGAKRDGEEAEFEKEKGKKEAWFDWQEGKEKR